MCPRSPLRTLFVVVLFIAAVCGALAAGHASAAPPPVFLPLVQPNQPPPPELGPPASVRARASAATVAAGHPVTLTATLLDAAGNLVPPNAILDVFLSVGGHDLLADRIATAPGPIGYSAMWTPPATGVYTVGAVAAFAADGAKAGLPVEPFTFTVTPGPVATLDLTAHTFASLALPEFLAATLYDAAGNALPNPPPGDVACTSNHAAIQAGTAQPLAGNFYADIYGVNLDASRQLGVPLAATGYDVAAVTCAHTPGGATDTATVAAAPWELRWRKYLGEPGVAFASSELFVATFSARAPSGAEWSNIELKMEWPLTQIMYFSDPSWGSPLPNEIVPFYWIEADGRIKLTATLNSSSTYSGTLAAIRATFQVQPFFYSPPPARFDFKVTGFKLSSPAGEIHYDPAPFDPWRTITVTVMPTQSLPAHVYVVAGAADPGDVDADLAHARRALAVNRGACLPAFDLQVQTTEIPAAAWATIDADGDGFDQWDADGDGDLAGPVDGDDFAAAAAAGYADPTPGTVNVYYVPAVRGAPALAGTSGGLALDGAQTDDWALFHLLVHTLDRRANGKHSLAHGPGAPGNALNPDLAGPFLTPEQCAALKPSE